MRLKKIMNNFHLLRAGNVLIWFSYETPIAIYCGNKQYIRENNWGQTTGKHMNYIDADKSIRIPSEEFEEIIRQYNPR